MGKPHLHWYARYFDAYLRDTKHLTLLEHGAYNLLLDHYYQQKGDVPYDLARLARVCNAFADEEQKALAKIIDEFFTIDGRSGKIRNRRADEEMKIAFEISDKRRSAANSRWNANAHANAMPPTPTPTPTPKTRSRTKATTAPSAVAFDAAAGVLSGFTDDHRKQWPVAYPALDLKAEIAAAGAWLKANPKNLKSNYERFLTNWLKKAQDRAPRVPAARKPGSTGVAI